ncbi:MAG: hypothetical protein V3T40_02715 [Nitrososphaerales archaeon]
MTWRSIDARGIIKSLPDSDVDKLQMQYSPVSEICEKHEIVCSGKRAYNLHVKEEHVY